MTPRCLPSTKKLSFWQSQKLRRLLGAALLLAPLRSEAQDPLKALPNNYKQIFDNSEVTVIQAHYGPHEKIPVHDHTALTTIFVYLSNSGPVRIDHADPGQPPESTVRPPTTAGAYRVAPAIAERHSIENFGDLSSDFLRVELKHVTLSFKEPFRGKAPTSLGKSSDVIELKDPGVQIERIICADFVCPVEPCGSPSLLISFKLPGERSTGGAHRASEKRVVWLPAGKGLNLSEESPSTPSQFLRILLPKAP